MSNAEPWPTEAAATAAVDAAARRQYELAKHDDWPAWKDLNPVHQLNIRDTVLQVVWAALTALPDPRYAAWEAGATSVELDGGLVFADNPYPAPVVPDHI